jgi:hypothetical protein
MLKAINGIAINNESYEVLDTKAFIQYLYGDSEDAKETANRAKKLASKQNIESSSIDALIEDMK